LLLFLLWLRACAKGGNADRALTLLQVVKDKKLPIDSYCYTAVIDGEWQPSVCIVVYIGFYFSFSNMLHFAWASIACAKAGLWRKALDFLAEMQENGVEATPVTYR
jgi:pentatricopeptide repeat protein